MLRTAYRRDRYSIDTAPVKVRCRPATCHRQFAATVKSSDYAPPWPMSRWYDKAPQVVIAVPVLRSPALVALHDLRLHERDCPPCGGRAGTYTAGYVRTPSSSTSSIYMY